MMNFVRDGLLAMMMTAVSLTAAGQTDSYQLQNRFAPGEPVYLQMQSQMNGQTTLRGQAMPLEMTLDSLLMFEPGALNEEGIATVTANLERMEMTVPTMGIREPMDLKSDVLSEDQSRFVLQLDAQGNVLDRSAAVTPSSSSMGGVESMSMEHTPYPPLPADPVGLGAQWRQQWQVPYAGASKPVIQHVTYTLAEIVQTGSGRHALIDTQSRIDVRDVDFDAIPSKQGGEDALKVKWHWNSYRVEGEGRLVFDMDQGRTLSFEEVKQIEQDLVQEMIVAGEGMASQMTQTLRMETEGRFAPDAAMIETATPEGEK